MLCLFNPSALEKNIRKSVRFCSALREDGFLHRQGTHHECCILDSLMGKLDHRNASPIYKLREKTCSHNVLFLSLSLFLDARLQDLFPVPLTISKYEEI